MEFGKLSSCSLEELHSVDCVLADLKCSDDPPANGPPKACKLEAWPALWVSSLVDRGGS